MVRKARWILSAAQLCLVFLALPLPGGEAPADPAESGRRVLFWIRAGALSAAELDPDPDTVPRLRELVLAGVTAAEVTADSRGDLLDASSLASALFAEPTLEKIRELRGSPAVRLGPEVPAVKPEAEGDARAGPAETRVTQDPAVAILAPRFGAPPPPSPEEKAALARIRAALGEPPPPEGEKTRAGSPHRGTPPALLAAAERALKDGAPLVIVCERVEDPTQAPERDRALGEAARRAADAGAAFLLFSSSAGPSPPRRTLVAAGPGVRRGRIIAEAKPLECVTAAALAILNVPPPAGPTPERIHVLEK